MHISFLPLLADSILGAEQSLQLETNQARGDIVLKEAVPSCNRFPIIRGVPRFAGNLIGSDYVASFGYQWEQMGTCPV